MQNVVLYSKFYELHVKYLKYVQLHFLTAFCRLSPLINILKLGPCDYTDYIKLGHNF